MPFLSRIVEKFSNQTLLLWRKIDSDASGRPDYQKPEEVVARLENSSDTVQTADGRTVQATGYLLTITPVAAQDLVFPGTKADWKALPTYPDLPTFGQGAREIVKVKKTPDLNAEETLFEAWT